MVLSNPLGLRDLEGDPTGNRVIFEQARPQGFGQTQRQRDIFSSMFERVMNDFLEEVGTNFRQGELPPQSFTDVVNRSDFDRQLKREGTGRGTSGSTSAARFLFDR